MDLAVIEVRQSDRKPLLVAVRATLDLGRDCDGLLLVDPEVSRRHLRLELREGTLTVNDLGSTNGTTMNGVSVERPVELGESDVVRLGSTEVQLVQRVTVDGVTLPARETGPAAPRSTVISGSGGETVVKGRADGTAARQTSIDAVAAAVDEEQPNVARLTGDGGTITIVFSDIESSTEMATQLGDTKWYSVLHQHNEIVRRVVERYKGTEVKAQGDGFMLTFPSARSAVVAMSEAQREFAVFTAEHPDTPVRVRIGLHTGEAIRDAGGDLFGKHIILAARIANLARGGEILASSITKEIASTRGDLHFGDVRDVTIKGFEGVHQVYEVIWDEFGNRDG